MAEKEMNFSTYLDLIMRYKYLILIILLISCTVGFLLFKYEVPEYTSKAYIEFDKESVSNYDIGDPQPWQSVITIAKSYHFTARVAENLKLINYPRKLSLFKRITTGKSEIYFDSMAELVFYYMGMIDVSLKSRSIEIIARNQNPKLAASIADEVAKLILQDDSYKKQEKLNLNIEFIDQQLKSISEMIERDRREQDRIATYLTYNEIVGLYRAIGLDTSKLSSLNRRKEEIELALALKPGEDTKKKLDLELDYLKEGIVETKKELESDKARLADIDKTDYNKYNDLKSTLQNNQRIYQNLLSQKQTILLADLIDSKRLKIISHAYLPIKPDRLKGISLIFASLIFGVGLSVGFIYLLEGMNNRFKSSREVEEAIGLKVIGRIPLINKKEQSKFLNPKQKPESSVVESYRTLATNLKFVTKGKKVKSIVFSSDKAGTGKSSTILNLGMTMADSRHKILLMEADLRRPRLFKMMNLNRKPGLTDVLSGKAKLEKAVVKIKKNLYLLPAGSLSYNPQSVLESAAMERLMKKVKRVYDFVFIDSIPLTSYTDIDITASLADASILVVDKKRSGKDTMLSSKKKLKTASSNILGAVVNKSKRKGKYYYNYYSYYRSYK